MKCSTVTPTPAARALLECKVSKVGYKGKREALHLCASLHFADIAAQQNMELDVQMGKE